MLQHVLPSMLFIVLLAGDKQKLQMHFCNTQPRCYYASVIMRMALENICGQDPSKKAMTALLIRLSLSLPRFCMARFSQWKDSKTLLCMSIGL